MRVCSLFPQGPGKWVDNELYAEFTAQKIGVCNNLALFLFISRAAIRYHHTSNKV